MEYKKIAELLQQEKGTRKEMKSLAIRFNGFAVCIDNEDNPFLVDNDMVDLIKTRSWCRSNGYPAIRLGDTIVRLHDCVMAMTYDKKPDDSYVDHINQDKSDNRRCNLRFVNPSRSAMNMPLRSDNTSGVKGVSKTKEGRYRAYITVDHKQKSLGQYATLEEAAEARKHGEELYGYGG